MAHWITVGLILVQTSRLPAALGQASFGAAAAAACRGASCDDALDSTGTSHCSWCVNGWVSRCNACTRACAMHECASDDANGTIEIEEDESDGIMYELLHQVFFPAHMQHAPDTHTCIRRGAPSVAGEL